MRPPQKEPALEGKVNDIAQANYPFIEFAIMKLKANGLKEMIGGVIVEKCC